MLENRKPDTGANIVDDLDLVFIIVYLSIIMIVITLWLFYLVPKLSKLDYL